MVVHFLENQHVHEDSKYFALAKYTLDQYDIMDVQ